MSKQTWQEVALDAAIERADRAQAERDKAQEQLTELREKLGAEVERLRREALHKVAPEAYHAQTYAADRLQSILDLSGDQSGVAPGEECACWCGGKTPGDGPRMDIVCLCCDMKECPVHGSGTRAGGS